MNQTEKQKLHSKENSLSNFSVYIFTITLSKVQEIFVSNRGKYDGHILFVTFHDQKATNKPVFVTLSISLWFRG